MPDNLFGTPERRRSSEFTDRGTHTEEIRMDMLIKQLKTVTAGRYHIVTETSSDGMQVDCLDLQCNLVATRKLSAAQLQNKILMTAVYADLKGSLGY